jgi:hypothetical protein
MQYTINMKRKRKNISDVTCVRLDGQSSRKFPVQVARQLDIRFWPLVYEILST